MWDDGGQLITTSITAVAPDPLPNQPVVTQGFYIKYHIAPNTIMQAPNDPDALVLGEFDLGERPEVFIQIYRLSGGSPAGGPVRTITEGYEPTNYPAPRYQPHGRFEVRADEAATDVLLGTCAYWDGFWDRDVPGEQTNGTNVNIVDFGTDYGAYLVVDGLMLTGAGQWIAFTKTA